MFKKSQISKETQVHVLSKGITLKASTFELSTFEPPSIINEENLARENDSPFQKLASSQGKLNPLFHILAPKNTKMDFS
ncbi:MAG TPA: hypothetical protein VGK06_02310 [Methanosarcina sp.]